MNCSCSFRASSCFSPVPEPVPLSGKIARQLLRDRAAADQVRFSPRRFVRSAAAIRSDRSPGVRRSGGPRSRAPRAPAWRNRCQRHLTPLLAAVVTSAVRSGGSSVARSIADELVSMRRSFCGGRGGGGFPGPAAEPGSSNSTRTICPAWSPPAERLRWRRSRRELAGLLDVRAVRVAEVVEPIDQLAFADALPLYSSKFLANTRGHTRSRSPCSRISICRDRVT